MGADGRASGDGFRDARAGDPSPVSADEMAAAQQRVDELLFGPLDKSTPPAGGQAAKRLAEAKTRVLEQITEVKRNLTLFNAELVAFEAAPQVYKVRKYLDTLQRSVQAIRKYIVVVDPAKRVIVEYEKEEKGTIELEPGN